MRKMLIASLLALAAAAPSLAQDAPADAEIEAAVAGEAEPLTGAEADAAVARASEWLDSVENLRGRFQQLNPDGSVAEGDFFIQRPGRLRFAYDPPSPLTILTDGRLYWQIDSALETADRVPLDETPLHFLLKSDIDLAKDSDVRGAARQDGLALISIGDASGKIGGQMVLIFSDPEFALREWMAVDEYGQQTRVILYDVQRPAELDADLFIHDAESGSRRPGQR